MFFSFYFVVVCVFILARIEIMQEREELCFDIIYRFNLLLAHDHDELIKMYFETLGS